MANLMCPFFLSEFAVTEFQIKYCFSLDTCVLIRCQLANCMFSNLEED